MIFYNLLLYFLFPFALLRLFSKKEFNTAELKRIKERFGPKDLKNCIQPIWIHAVSVGVVFLLFISSLEFVKIAITYPETIGPLIPLWFAQSIIPIGFLLIWYHMIMTSSSKLKYRLSLVFYSLLIALIFYYWQSPFSSEILLIITPRQPHILTIV